MPGGPTSSPVSHPTNPACDQVDLELIEDGLPTGEPHRRGTAGAAFRYPTFRRVYLGSLLSNVGTWMQNVCLGAFVFEQTHSSAWVGVMTLAQLGPLMALSLVGGAIADRFDRRTVLIIVSIEQGLFALVIGQLVRAETPNMAALILAVLAIGIGQAVYAPTYSALIPTLVDRVDMPGAISLNSASMNLSRVIGPAIGGVLFAKVGAPWVMAGNAVTYLFIIGALWSVHLPRAVIAAGGSRWERIVEGVRAAQDDPVVSRCLTTMVGFSFFCLPIAVLMPDLARNNLGVDPKSVAYGFLYASFGAGAMCGALAIGTFLAHRDLARVVRFGLAGFAVALAAYALVRRIELAYPIAFALGFCYFGSVTSLSTVLQQRLDDHVRGRVMALWVMAFGGTVPIGAMVAGPVADAIGITPVLLFGAVVAAALVLYADLARTTTPAMTQPA